MTDALSSWCLLCSAQWKRLGINGQRDCLHVKWSSWILDELGDLHLSYVLQVKPARTTTLTEWQLALSNCFSQAQIASIQTHLFKSNCLFKQNTEYWFWAMSLEALRPCITAGFQNHCIMCVILEPDSAHWLPGTIPVVVQSSHVNCCHSSSALSWWVGMLTAVSASMVWGNCRSLPKLLWLRPRETRCRAYKESHSKAAIHGVLATIAWRNYGLFRIAHLFE